MNKKQLGFALVGCGRIVHKHAEALSGAIRGAKLIAVCDIKAERARAAGEKYGVPFFTDMHEMLRKKNESIDVINILTESGHHARDCLALIPYGKHMVVEKPMALTLEDADAMIAACKQTGVQLFIVKQNRFNLPVQRLRKALEQNRFGKMIMGTVRVRWCRPQSYYDQDAWRGTWALDGGVFTNQASHHVDLLEWMLGEPVSVFAYGRTALADIEVEDTGAALIRFRSGAIGIIEATTATRPKDVEGSLSIIGEKGMVEIGGFAVNQMKLWQFNDMEKSEQELLHAASEYPPNVYGFGHISYLNHVVEVILRGQASLVDGEEARKSLELIHAIYQSIETGKEVVLSQGPNSALLGKTNA